jgi:hypothetical protein
VSLRLADLLDGLVDSEGLIAAIRDRAHYLDAADLVDQLTQRGLLDSGRLTPLARELTSSLQATINTETASIWNDLPGDDVAAATRLLNEVVARGRVLLA